ncbi:hypothetical protein I2I05_12750 [Hymenobacter sp. BT683]|uniref:DUF4251 domain-containing protein n=1 Tax=Hymenobacter jeongseonensis TaxID=2791027 RepID=A0ABS0IIU9_9BACT|nr:hypothetical protein [Hymenobacter jeongseonensis]MBF9238266.1 hypothetical protein [Hymenobacter jeongseonensis]
MFPLLASALLVGSAARAQAPAAEVQALTTRLNQLMRNSGAENNGMAFVSLANCGLKQTVRKYRTPDDRNSGNISVSSSKKGSSWGLKTDDKVQFELNLALEWSEVGSVSYAPKTNEKGGGRYYDVTIRRRAKTNGEEASGIADTISLALHTDNEKEVASLVKKLDAVRRQCSGRQG